VQEKACKTERINFQDDLSDLIFIKMYGAIAEFTLNCNCL